LSSAQVKQLVKFTESKQIILNFDADKAGNIAAERAIGEVTELAYQGQLQLRILNLPTGKDADEFLRNHSQADYLSLLDNAPLWLDWQLDKAIEGQDLTQAEQYQAATQKIIKLLQNITDVTTRIHYLQKSAGLLSAGDARMIPLLFENLQTAIKGLKPLPEARSVGSSLPANKFNQSSQSNQSKYSAPESIEDNEPIEFETSDRVEIAPISIHPSQRLIEQAEGLLLRIYLHYPIHRLTIIDELDSANLTFTLAHHSFLWQQIVERSSLSHQQDPPQEEIDYLDDRLMAKLQDSMAEYPGRANQIKHLFNLDEHTAEEIQRSPLVLRAAIACLEKFACEQQRKYYLNKLQSNDPEDLAKKIEYYQSFTTTQQRLQELAQQRNVTIDDLISFI
jgi:DNA primase